MFAGWKGVVLVCAVLALLGLLAYLKVDGAAVAAIAVVTTLVTYFTRSPSKDEPPPGAKLVPIFAIGSILAGVASGCNEPKAVSPPCKSMDLTVPECAALYEQQLIECNATATVRAQSQLCEEQVRAQFHRPPLDAGKDGAS